MVITIEFAFEKQVLYNNILKHLWPKYIDIFDKFRNINSIFHRSYLI